MRMVSNSMAAAIIAVAWSASPAAAERPTEGGIFTYDPSDVLEYWEEPTGTVRVHYSVSGPNVTVLDDDDGDGVPDYPQLVALTTRAVFDFYSNDRGFHPPVSEADLGLGEPGGSPAFDVYLLDFGGNADGSFGLDDCIYTPQVRCAGYFAMENDFLGYNYPSLEYATNVLTSHELFHAVQYAYTFGLPVWLSEGTATWAEKQWDTESGDFLRLTRGFLQDTERSIDRPPGGPVPAFAYGTALFFDFLSTRSDHTVVVDIMESLDNAPEDVDVMAEIEAVLGGPDALRSEWVDFVVWNLASGARTGDVVSYPYAEELIGITATAEGDAIDDDNRFYPLAASYYLLRHSGGPIYFGIEVAAPELRLGLHPVTGGADDGPIGEAVATWTADAAASWPLLDGVDLPEGSYWLWVTKPERAANSTHVRICLGNLDTATGCAPLAPDIPDPPDPVDPVDPVQVEGGGCSASAASSSVTGWPLLLFMALGLARMRRRRAAPVVVDR